MKNVVVIGASGHAGVVLDCIEKEGKYNIIGLIDSFKEKGKLLHGYAILGNENDLPHLIKRYDLFGGIIAIGDNVMRKQIADKVNKILPNFNFINAVHPNACIGKEVYIGRGTVVMPGVVINANSIVGDFCILNTYASLDHDGRMEDFSSLAPRACVGGNFTLGKLSSICLGANVINNITVGANTLVGAGSLVVNNIVGNVVAYGQPAKVVRTRLEGDECLRENDVEPRELPLMRWIK